MTKKELLTLLEKHSYCRIKKSKLDGIGVFAIKNIPKNTDPFKGSGNARWFGFTANEIAKLDPQVKKMVYDFFSIQNGKIWIPEGGINAIDISFYMNASKKPNVRAFRGGEEFRTLHVIKAGEELTVDYHTFSQSPLN